MDTASSMIDVDRATPLFGVGWCFSPFWTERATRGGADGSLRGRAWTRYDTAPCP